MKKIFFLCLITLFFIQCSSDEKSSFNTITVGEVVYKMPIMSSDAQEVKSYLTSIAADVVENKTGSKTIIEATMTESENKLFSSFLYEIEEVEGELNKLSLTYKYRNLNSVDKQVQNKIRDYFKENTSIRL